MSFVLDRSVTLSWCFEGERLEATDALLTQVVESGAGAPSLWSLEILNALSMAERRRRIDADRRQRLCGFLHDLPVNIDVETASRAWAATSQLAARFKLTLYDADYLELAQRLNLPLATLDKELRVAGRALGIALQP